MLDLPPNAVLADKCPVEVPLQVDPYLHPLYTLCMQCYPTYAGKC